MTDDKLRAALERAAIDVVAAFVLDGDLDAAADVLETALARRFGLDPDKASINDLYAALAVSATDEGPTTSDLGSEYGRLLAERDRLIAAGVDPSALEVIDSMARPAVTDEGPQAGYVAATLAADADVKLLARAMARANMTNHSPEEAEDHWRSYEPEAERLANALAVIARPAVPALDVLRDLALRSASGGSTDD